jgi:hypothetical protein
MNGFKSTVLAAESLISFLRNFLGAIRFSFDRKTKYTFADADPGPRKTPIAQR